jgi:hypothetical protein
VTAGPSDRSIASLLAAQDGRDVRRLHPEHRVWQLTWPGVFARSRRARIAGLQTCRAEIARKLGSMGSPRFIDHPDPPADYDVPGHWECVGGQTWRIPAECAFEDRASAAWLALGCWVVYAAPDPVTEPWPDMFRLPPEELMQWIEARNVRAAIASFHDDDEWRIVVSGDVERVS